MRLKKTLGAVAATALMALLGSGTASATILTSPAGTQLSAGTSIKAELSESSILHPPIGEIKCNKSTFEGKTTNSGGASETVKVELGGLAFSECNATVTVLKRGTFEIHTEGGSANGNGKVKWIGLETTISYLGFHCVFSSDPISFTIGFIAGAVFMSAVIIAVLKVTGGSSGVFCGSTAQWTGKYKITSPQPLFVD